MSDFAYRIEPGLLTFVAAAGIVLGIAWLTVAYQSMKAARIDPVKALRYD